MTHSNVNKFTSTFKNMFNRSKSKKISTRTGGGARAFLSKLSGAFLLPISVLAIAGLLLGVGATIAGNAGGNKWVEVLGNFIKQLGDPLFGALPLLFTAALAVSFTEEAGVAVFNAIIGYLIFSALQSVFIQEIAEVKDDAGNVIAPAYKSLLFGGWGLEFPKIQSLFGTTLGFVSMQTSVFGGIIVGFLVQWAYNRFHTTQLPQAISFFSGKRFVAFVVIALMIPLVFIFLLLWPYVAAGFNWFGQNSGKIPYGFDSFIFGFIERSLVPFGLHHVFYSPLWYTSAGGDVGQSLTEWLKDGNHAIDRNQLLELASILKSNLKEADIAGITSVTGNMINFVSNTNLTVAGSVQGDSTTTVALVGVSSNIINFATKDASGNWVSHSQPLYEFVANNLGIKLGRFLDGKFSFMPWGLPFAGLAIVLAAPKENRNMALGVVLPASLTSFVTGVTEPIEFTFLFLAPALFFGFHALMCALAFMLANLLGVHIGMTFSGGFLDLVIYGMLPVLKGTNFWWTIVVGLAYAPIYYFVFYFWIIKADLPTPGRGGNTKLFTKKDFQATRDAEGENLERVGIDPQTIKIIEAFGGKENIVKTGNCASRLRFDVKDSGAVDEQKLKAAGAFGLRRTSPTHVQAIFGPLSETLRTKIDHALASNHDLSSSSMNHDNDGSEMFHSLKSSSYVKRDDLSQSANEYLEFLSLFGGRANIDKLTLANDTFTFYFKKPIDLNKDYHLSLFNNSASSIAKDYVKLTFNKNITNVKALITQVNKEIASNNENVHSPIENGKIKSLASLKDGVFSDKILGDGFVVAQSDGKVYAPISGEIVAVFPTKHAYGIKAKNGLNVLVHIGIDTVKLNGKGFKSTIKQGAFVKQGDLLATVDLEMLKNKDIKSDVIVVVTSDSAVQPQPIMIKNSKKVSTKDIIIDKFK